METTAQRCLRSFLERSNTASAALGVDLEMQASVDKAPTAYHIDRGTDSLAYGIISRRCHFVLA